MESRGGEYSTKFYTWDRRLRLEVQTLTLLYAYFYIEKVPPYTFHGKLYPFHILIDRGVATCTHGRTCVPEKMGDFTLASQVRLKSYLSRKLCVKTNLK